MKPLMLLLAILVLVSPTGDACLAQAKSAQRTLNIYFIDVEGGGATLIVTPARESILLDAGWGEAEGRDAKRIQQAMQQAGITTIDHLIVSHYHRDHYGGVADLSRLVTVKRFYDHGKMTSLSEDSQFTERYAAYQTAARGETITLKAGDTIPLKMAPGLAPMKLLVVAANGAVIGGKTAANSECDSAPAAATEINENGRSVALLLNWGEFDFLNLADLTPTISRGLICPSNQIGEIDVYQATHHGGNLANYPILLRSLRPTVTVMINGPRKGGHPDTFKLLQGLSASKGVYQLHRNVESTAEQNTPAELIANLEEQPDAGHLIAIEVDAAQRNFTVTNGRTKGRQSFRIK